jgi:hypothetical protein
MTKRTVLVIAMLLVAAPMLLCAGCLGGCALRRVRPSITIPLPRLWGETSHPPRPYRPPPRPYVVPVPVPVRPYSPQVAPTQPIQPSETQRITTVFTILGAVVMACLAAFSIVLSVVLAIRGNAKQVTK